MVGPWVDSPTQNVGPATGGEIILVIVVGGGSLLLKGDWNGTMWGEVLGGGGPVIVIVGRYMDQKGPFLGKG